MRGIIATCFLASFITIAKPVQAQYYFYNENYFDRNVTVEFGGLIGVKNCLTDPGGKKGIGKGFIKDLICKYHKACFSILASAT